MKTTFYEQIKKVPFLKILIFYSLGIGLARFIIPEEGLFTLVQLLLVISFLAQIFFFFYRSKLAIIFALNSYFILFFFGMWNIWKGHSQIDETHFYRGSNDQFIAVVDDEPIFSKNTIRFPVLLVAKRSESSFQRATGKMMMTIAVDSSSRSILYGDEILFINKVKHISTPYNPLEFNYKNYLNNQGIDSQIYLNAKDYKIIRHNQGNAIKALALHLRQGLVNKFRKYISDEESFQIAVALIVGYRSTMAPEVIQTFSNTGTIHVLSVSGMHVGIVFLFLMWVLQKVNGTYMLNFIKIALLLCAIWCYTLLTGMAPSILRAAIMLSFFLIAKSIQSEPNMLNTMASSAFLLLIVQPNILFDIGFQLSYCAVLGIVLIFPQFKKLSFLDGNRFGRIVWDSSAVSLSAQIMTAPLSLFYFGQFPNYFLIANVLVVLPVTIIMYIGIVMMFLPFDMFNMWLGYIMDWLIKQMFVMLQFLDHLPYATWSGIVFSPLMVLGSTMLLLFCSYAFYWKDRKALYFTFFLFMTLAIFFSYQQYQQQNYIGFRMYNTRKELALAFIKHRKVTVLSSFDSLNSKNLMYSANRDLSRFTNWKDIDFKPLGLNDSVRINYLIQKANFTIQIIEHSSVQFVPTDILVIRKNSNWNFVENVERIQPKLVLFDATSSDVNILRWKYQLDSLGIANHSIKNNFAYVWNEELL